ncbi:MAG: ATPase domain-containing protein [Candidatus Micrarchaeia archaeon]
MEGRNDGVTVGRIKTGIPGLDELISGGFEEKSVVIVTGPAGSGKSTLALQFLYNGATVSGEPGIYITFEEQKAMLYKHMMNYGWDFAKLEKEGKFRLFEYPPHEVDRFLSEGGAIEDCIEEMKARRLVIDSITSFMLLYETEYKRRQAFLNAMQTLRKWGCMCLLTAEGETDAHGNVTARFGLEFLADGLIAIHMIRRGDIRDLAIEIVKLRGIPHQRKLSPMMITESGVVVFPNQPVFGEAKF